MSEIEPLTLPAGHPQAGYVGYDPSPAFGTGTVPPAEEAIAEARNEAYEEDVAVVVEAENEVASEIHEERQEPNLIVGSLDPGSCSISGTELVLLHVRGSGFTETTQIWWHDHLEPTEFVSPNEVTTFVTPWLFLVPDYVEVGVQDNGVDGDKKLLFALLP